MLFKPALSPLVKSNVHTIQQTGFLFTQEFIPFGFAYMADWANTLPRKILGYRTPDELFEAELDRIYAL